MKKTFRPFYLALAAALSFGACGDDNPQTQNNVKTCGVCNSQPNQCEKASRDNIDQDSCQCWDFQPAGTACDDGNSETTGDVCDGKGGCKGTPQAGCDQFCAPCSPEPGQCEKASRTSIDDPCSCQCWDFQPAGTACDDGNAETTGDVCDDKGVCKGTPEVGCDRFCDSCNPEPGQCEKASRTSIDDPCSCQCWDFQPAGTACDDGNSETTGDVCDGQGSCTGTAARS